MKRVWETVRTGFWGGVLGLVLIMPVVVYMQVFGDKISHSHTRWAEMGSALSGIYGPILTILTVSLLIHQLRLQQQTNKHMFDQAHVQQADADIAFYLGRLESALKGVDFSGKPTGRALQAMFMAATLDQLRETPVIAAAQITNREHSELFGAWCAFQSVVAGLGAVKEHPFEKSLSSARQRAIVVLSFDMCVTLDNYVWCLTEGRLNGPYLFSPLPLNQR